MKRALGSLLPIVGLILLTACGEVVTPEPTAETPSAATEVAVGSTPTHRPTATAPILPPADTATPTITPTPVVHVVQQGETLQGIAFDYGVGLEALQAANNIDSPQFLQVGQELIIPVEQETNDEAPGLLLPTPTPVPFQRQGIAFYETPVGGLWGLGEVVNTTESPLTNVQLQVTLFNASGEPLVEADTFTAVELIPPGTQSPFGILFTDPPQDWASSQVTIIRGQAAGALAEAYVPMTVAEVEGRPAGSQFLVKGVAQNASADKVADRASVVVTTYDAEGAVTGFREHGLTLEEGLPPGATVPFEMVFTFYGDSPADFNVIAQGRSPAE